MTGGVTSGASGGASLRRIVVAGVSGSGKTTLARRVAARLSLPYVEMDALHHGAGWTPRPEFLEDVEAFVAQDSWVTEYQYGAAKPLLLERATVVVWLDLPTWRTMWQVTRRTVSRRVRRTELWNGNREGPLRAFLTDPDHVVRWAWRTRDRLRVELPGLVDARPGLSVVRLRSHAEAAAWLAGLT